MKDLLRHDSFKLYKLSSLKCISFGGSYLSKDVEEQLKAAFPKVQIDNFYGILNAFYIRIQQSTFNKTAYQWSNATSGNFVHTPSYTYNIIKFRFLCACACVLIGLTEVGSRCNDPGSRPTKLGSIGFLKSNMQMKVISPKTEETLGPYRIGELCFKSATAMTGYYKDPEATHKVVDNQGRLVLREKFKKSKEYNHT